MRILAINPNATAAKIVTSMAAAPFVAAAAAQARAAGFDAVIVSCFDDTGL